MLVVRNLCSLRVGDNPSVVIWWYWGVSMDLSGQPSAPMRVLDFLQKEVDMDQSKPL